ncbi:MAG: hypothetical protein ACYC8T_09645 [Myxococcaceae bacterium]
MKYFLLVYNRRAGHVQKLSVYPESDRERAITDRFALEQKEREHPEMEVVLLGAASLEDLERTHARYFETTGQIAAHLLAAVS